MHPSDRIAWWNEWIEFLSTVTDGVCFRLSLCLWRIRQENDDDGRGWPKLRDWVERWRMNRVELATWDQQEEKKGISGDRITRWHRRRRPVSLLDPMEEVVVKREREKGREREGEKERKKSLAFNIHVRLSCCCSFAFFRVLRTLYFAFFLPDSCFLPIPSGVFLSFRLSLTVNPPSSFLLLVIFFSLDWLQLQLLFLFRLWCFFFSIRFVCSAFEFYTVFTSWVFFLSFLPLFVFLFLWRSLSSLHSLLPSLLPVWVSLTSKRVTTRTSGVNTLSSSSPSSLPLFPPDAQLLFQCRLMPEEGRINEEDKCSCSSCLLVFYEECLSSKQTRKNNVEWKRKDARRVNFPL